MKNVTIVDERPKWMLKEDILASCFLHCGMFQRCSSKFGERCKQLGGSEIPKLQSKKISWETFSI